ncbi:MAG: ATPase, T2SS/T4P/T4SS family, partial [Verrucomicrobiia bacterium]
MGNESLGVSKYSGLLAKILSGSALEKPPLVGNERLKNILPREKLIRLQLVPIRYDERSSLLVVGTVPEMVGEVEAMLTKYATNEAFIKVVGTKKNKINFKVFPYSQEEVREAMSRYYDIKNPQNLKIDQELLRIIDEQIYWEYRVIPIKIIGATVYFYAEDALGRQFIRELIKGVEVRQCISRYRTGTDSLTENLTAHVEMVMPGTVHAILSNMVGVDRDIQRKIDENISTIREQSRQTRPAETKENEEKSGAIENLIKYTLVKLVEQKYSDLKIEYNFSEGKIIFSARQMGRYEIIEQHKIDVDDYQRIVTWILRQMNANTPLHVPANGPLVLKNVHFKRDNKVKNIVMRASYLPLVDTNHREAMCNGRFSLRILNEEGAFMDLEELGYSHADLAVINQIIRNRNGLVLLVGEMGSGKSATANAMLARKAQNEVGKDFISIEKPVEYHNPYVSQVEIREAQGLTVMNYLETLVRQGTNGVFVGEVGESQMARMLTTMAMNGIFVMSTFHARSPFAAVQRITAPPFEIASADFAAGIIAIIHQKLVRKLCPHCAQPDREWRGRILKRENGRQLLDMLESLLKVEGMQESEENFQKLFYTTWGRYFWD